MAAPIVWTTEAKGNLGSPTRPELRDLFSEDEPATMKQFKPPVLVCSVLVFLDRILLALSLRVYLQAWNWKTGNPLGT